MNSKLHLLCHLALQPGIFLIFRNHMVQFQYEQPPVVSIRFIIQILRHAVCREQQLRPAAKVRRVLSLLLIDKHILPDGFLYHIGG